MDNCSNCTTPQPDTFQNIGFLVFTVLMLITAVAAILFNLLTVVVLCTRQEVIQPLRILLFNLLAGTLFTAVAVVIQSTHSIILVSNPNGTVDDTVCRVYVWFFRSSAAVRLCNLAVYSIGVMVVVIKGKKVLKSVHLLLPIAITWLYALLICVYWVIPSVSTYINIGPGKAWCTTNSSADHPEKILPSAMTVTLGGIFPMTICVVVIISTWCHLRKHKLSEVTMFKKALLRLALFLFLANTFNLINTTVPPIVIQFDPNQGIIPYVVSTVVTILLWTTATIIVIFIQPVRTEMLAILCCSHCKCQPSKNLRRRMQVSLPDEDTTLLYKSN